MIGHRRTAKSNLQIDLDLNRIDRYSAPDLEYAGVDRTQRGCVQFLSLSLCAEWSRKWLISSAFPIWASHGFDASAQIFRESLQHDFSPGPGLHRLRVQSRQTFVFIQAGKLGWDGPWRERAQSGLDILLKDSKTENGAVGYRLDASRQMVDSRWDLYDQAFGLFGLAHARPLAPEAVDLRVTEILDFLEQQSGPVGGFLEGSVTPHPRQQNPHMHLLEAGLALKAAGIERGQSLIDSVAHLLATHFYDTKSGALPEYYDERLRALGGELGQVAEPGHHCEWAWLLDKLERSGWGPAAEIGERFWNHAMTHGRVNGVLIDEVWLEGGIRTPTARLWPQTEWLKAALVRYERSPSTERLETALAAFRGLMRYLEHVPGGLWQDRLEPDGKFVSQPAPATSLYHILLAMTELFRVAEATGA